MTTQPSLRAEARRCYVEAADAEGFAAPAASETPLTAQVRSLYEDTIVPVREIARLAGVTERTIYKYATRHGWRPRVVRLSRGPGGRFAPLDAASQPVAKGLAALDPAGATRAAEACRRAGLLSEGAAAAAVAAANARAAHRAAEQEAEARLRALDTLNGALATLGGLRTRGAHADVLAVAARVEDAVMEAITRVLGRGISRREPAARFNLPQS